MICEYIRRKKPTMLAPYGVWVYTGKGVTIVSFWTKAGKQTSLRSRNPYSEYWWEKLRKLYGRYGPRKPLKPKQ